MSIKQESETSWEMVTACDGHNSYDSITATKDGLEIGYCGMIPWERLDEARAIATAAGQSKDNEDEQAQALGLGLYGESVANSPSIIETQRRYTASLKHRIDHDI